MMGFDDILTTIALGGRLARAIVSLKKHVDALRSGATFEYSQPSALEALDRRTADLELLASRQAARINALETGLEDASAVTDALAHRVGTIFWIALIGGTVALIALVLSIVVMAHAG